MRAIPPFSWLSHGCFLLPLLTGASLALAADPDAILFYSFDKKRDDAEVQVVADESEKKTYSGTLYGAAEYTPQGKGYAMAFDGRTSFIRCGRKGVPKFGSDAFSIGFWIKADSLSGGTVMGQKGEDPNASGWLIELAPTGDLIWTMADGEKSESLKIALPSPDAWNYVTVVREGDKVQAYLNGQLVEEKRNEVFSTHLYTPDVHLNLGKLIGKFRSFSGRLDNVLISARALTPQEVATSFTSEQSSMEAVKANPDEESKSLVLHYRFDKDPGEVAKDLSGYENDGKIAHAKYLEEVEGRKGVLRFDGELASLDLGNPKSLQFGGDLSFEMWVRLNRPLNQKHDFKGIIFGEYPSGDRLKFGWMYYETLIGAYGNPRNANYVPIDRTFIGDKWAHIAVVFEHPRARVYQNGKLVVDQIMLLKSADKLLGAKFLGGEPEWKGATSKPKAEPNNAPIDLAEFRLYKRALSATEIASHMEGREIAEAKSEELAVEPNWYKGNLTLRLVSKGRNLAGKKAEFLAKVDGQEIKLGEEALRDVSGNHSGRYSAEWVGPIGNLEGKNVTFSAAVSGKADWNAQRIVQVSQPEWISAHAGATDKVLAPWTPVKVDRNEGGEVSFEVWGRRYLFDGDIFPKQIEAKGAKLLTGAMNLKSEANGKPIVWEKSPLKVSQISDAAALIEQTLQSDNLAVKVLGRMEYDGYMTFDCEVKARKDVRLNHLILDIPLGSKHAELCAATHVYLPQAGISMSESYWDAVRGDLDFRFAPSIWLGDNERGLTWQSESGEFWRNNDPQKAIQIRPSKGTTTFQANLVGDATDLVAGETLKYKFALLATPVKPMLRNAWDLRVMRSGPMGKEFDLPDREIEGKPQLQYIADQGVRNIYWHISTRHWPSPTPDDERLEKQIKRLNQAAKVVGLRLNPYALHIRFPLAIEEFNQYGADIVQHPIRVSAWGMGIPTSMDKPRPGNFAFIANTQMCAQYCPNSRAMQDGYLYRLQKRFKEYGDSGVYLDGTAQVMPCTNAEHGCGYQGADGKLNPTFPVFSSREYIRRIYNIVKENDPEAIVDLHYWSPNPAQAAYSDINFSGEQWSQLKWTGAKQATDALPLERFRSMFMGYQIGTPVDLMSYRIGSTRKLAAISMLHDVPVRLNQGGRSLEQLVIPANNSSGEDDALVKRISEDAEYFKLLTTFWKVRDEFDIKNAEYLFYWKNADYVTVAPSLCYTTLFRHPRNGVLAIVSNLGPDQQDVKVRLDLEKLGLSGKTLEVFNPLTEKVYTVTTEGMVSVPLESQDWSCLWIRPIVSNTTQTAKAK